MSGKPSLVIGFDLDDKNRPLAETITVRVENAPTPEDRARLYAWIVNRCPKLRLVAEAAGLGYLDEHREDAQ